MVVSWLFLSFFCYTAAQITLQPNPISGFSGSNVVINCAKNPNDTDPTFRLRINGVLFGSSHPKFVNVSSSGSVASYTYGPLERDENMFNFTCTDGGGNQDTASINVYYQYQVDNPSPNTIITEERQPAKLNFTVTLGNPADAIPILLFNTTSVDNRSYTVNRVLNQIWEVTFSNPTTADSGTYSVRFTNVAGPAENQFQLIVRAGDGTILPARICYECIFPPIGVCLLLLLLIIILIIIIYCICCKKREPASEKLSDEKDEEKL